MEIARIIDKTLEEYYSEQGKPVPCWKRKDPDWWILYLKEWYSEQGKEVPVWKTRDPQWWIDYLSELGIDPRNP